MWRGCGSAQISGAAVDGCCFVDWLGCGNSIVAILKIRSTGLGIGYLRGARGDGTQDGGIDCPAYCRGVGKGGQVEVQAIGFIRFFCNVSSRENKLFHTATDIAFWPRDEVSDIGKRMVEVRQ